VFRALPRGPRPAGHPVTVGPPTGERAKRHGSRWSALPDERPGPVALGLLGSCLGRWCRGDQASTPATRQPRPCGASILEPEVPAGGMIGRTLSMCCS